MLLRVCFLFLVLFYLSNLERELKLSAHKPLQDFLPSVQARMPARMEAPVSFSLGLGGLSYKWECSQPPRKSVHVWNNISLPLSDPTSTWEKIKCEILWSLSLMMKLPDFLTFLLWERHQPWIPGSVILLLSSSLLCLPHDRPVSLRDEGLRQRSQLTKKMAGYCLKITILLGSEWEVLFIERKRKKPGGTKVKRQNREGEAVGK